LKAYKRSQIAILILSENPICFILNNAKKLNLFASLMGSILICVIGNSL